MASCLWMCPSLLIIIIVTFVSTEEIKDNITCTFTNGKDCLHLLDMNDTRYYRIEKEDINRTGVKIIFDSEQGVEFLHIKSGEALENRVQVLNVTRGSLNHLVNLSCSLEWEVDKVKLEPVIATKEVQIDFVKGCGNDSDPIIIKSIDYDVGMVAMVDPQEATQKIPLMEEEAETDEAYIPTEKSDTELLTTPRDQKVQKEEFEETTVKTTSRLMTKIKTPIPTTLPTKRPTEKSMKVTKKNPTEEKADANKINFSASKSSAWKASHDFACLFLALLIFRNA